MSYPNKKNKFAQDPQRQPPPGWKVDNWLFQKVLADAQRTGSQTLIAQVEELRTHDRKDVAKVVNVVSRAAKGQVDAEALNLKEYYENNR